MVGAPDRRKESPLRAGRNSFRHAAGCGPHVRRRERGRADPAPSVKADPPRRAYTALLPAAAVPLGRIRECPGDGTCGWLFLDHSKNATRQWREMRTCGNRAKARRHHMWLGGGSQPGGGAQMNCPLFPPGAAGLAVTGSKAARRRSSRQREAFVGRAAADQAGSARIQARPGLDWRAGAGQHGARITEGEGASPWRLTFP
ncbi:MAG: CGNR zinc finger domain-containing protein [Streptosporangiaceae bacterium]